MRWESRLLEVIDDLEQQASGLHLVERDLEVDDLAQAEYAQVTLASRCRASVGHDVALRVLGGLVLRGRLVRCGEEWLVLQDRGTAWLVPTTAVVSASGLSERSSPEATWSVADRLSLRSVLRRAAAEADTCQVHLGDGERVEGRIARVGRDFLELSGAVPLVVPLRTTAAVRWRSW